MKESWSIRPYGSLHRAVAGIQRLDWDIKTTMADGGLALV